MDWIHLVQYRDQWRALVNTVIIIIVIIIIIYYYHCEWAFT
jgi:hypothetical protein